MSDAWRIIAVGALVALLAVVGILALVGLAVHR